MWKVTRVALAATLSLLSLAALALPAAAAAFLTFVSATGNDANTCVVQASPCQTLQRAVNATSPDGEVRLLSSLIGGAIVNRSITINGAGNTVIGAITINNSSSRVVLRQLNLSGRGTLPHGINIVSAAAVHIEDCNVERYADHGISFSSTSLTRLVVANTFVHANGSDGLHVEDSNAIVAIENSRFEGMSSTGIYLRASRVTILHSVAYGNVNHGIQLRTPDAKITETTANDNGTDGLISDETTARVQIVDSRFESNVNAGVYLEVATANVTRSIMSGNGGDGIILASGRNRIRDSAADDNGGKGFSALAGTIDTLFDAVEANGNGSYGLDVATGATALITNCVFGDKNNPFAAIAVHGSLRSMGNNFVPSRTGNPPTLVPET